MKLVDRQRMSASGDRVIHAALATGSSASAYTFDGKQREWA